MTGNNNALVLGATGGIGGEVARQLVATGWNVRALRRGGQPTVGLSDGITWIGGDAMNRDEVVAAATGIQREVIYARALALKPPG